MNWSAELVNWKSAPSYHSRLLQCANIIGIHVPAPLSIGHELQVADVLIAITNIAGQHPLNQARLASLADPLTEALASVLQALPPLALAATAVVTSSQPDNLTNSKMSSNTQTDTSLQGRSASQRS